MLEAEDRFSINNKGSSVQDVFTASENNSNGIISYCVGESNDKTLLIFYQANYMDRQGKVIDDVVMIGPLGQMAGNMLLRKNFQNITGVYATARLKLSSHLVDGVAMQ